MSEDLNEKQKQFGREYVIDRNAAAAYVRAGYAKKCAQSAGSRLLRDPRMQAFLVELGIEIAERAGITTDLVVKNLIQDRKDARAAGQYGPAVRADELLGKTFSMFTDVNKNVVVDDISPEDAITGICTQNGIVHETARVLFMQGLEALKTPYHTDDEEPTSPTPTQPAPRMVQ